MSDSEIPRIEAECAKCGHVFDVRWGLGCPACHHTGPNWVVLASEQETAIAATMRTATDAWEEIQKRRSVYPGIMGYPYAHTEGDLKDIAELNRMISLEDNR